MEERLLNAIEYDKQQSGNYSRYPSRFIFLPLNKDSYSLIVSICAKKSISIIKLSDCNSSNNTVITPSLLLNSIEEKINNSTNDLLFIGLSEICRLYDDEDFESVIRTIIEFENTCLSSRRLFFPLFSCYEKTSEIVRNYIEKNYYPILKTDGIMIHYDSFNVYFHKNVNVEASGLKCTKDYYNLINEIYAGKVDNNKVLCLSPKIVYYLNDKKIINDSYFTINTFSSSKDICSYYISDFNKNNNYNFDDNDYESLINHIGFEQTSVHKLVSKFFGNISSDFIINNLLSATETSLKMLLWMYILNNDDSILYKLLGNVYKGMSNINDNSFIEALFEVIRDRDLYLLPNYEEYHKNRKDLIDKIISKNLISYNNYEFDDRLENIISNSYQYLVNSILLNEDLPTIDLSVTDITSYFDIDMNFQRALKKNAKKYILSSLTSYSRFERKFIIWLLNFEIVDIEDVKDIYPELFNYICFNMKQYTKIDDIDDYFIEYRKSKLLGHPTSMYADKALCYKNNDFDTSSYDVFYKWYSRVPKRTFDGVDKVIGFDGVGYEYCGYIVYLLSQCKYISILSAEMCSAKLPTITSINKDNIKEEFNKFDDLIPDYDSEVIHQDYYNKINSIEKSLTVIKKMVNNLIGTLKVGESVVLTSDHGSTVQHKILQTSKKYSFEKSEHDGRCCKVSADDVYVENNPDYIAYKVYNTNDKWLLATGNFSLYNTPKYEAHGGATIEEVCVPKITFAYSKNITYKVNLLTRYINGIQKNISFTVSPIPGFDVFVMEESGNLIRCSLNKGAYFATLSNGRTQKIKIKISNFEFEELIHNNSMNTEGDDFF